MASNSLRALFRVGAFAASALSLTLLAACGTDAPASGSIVCSASADCPTGSVCEGGFCVASTIITDSGVSDTGTESDTTEGTDTTDTTPDIDPALCGNRIVEGDEQCDDGNRDPLDECDACRFTCGDGTVAGTETCDTAIPAGEAGSCPTECTPTESCSTSRLEGTACTAVCVEEQVTACAAGDGCCGAGCSAADDSDCQAVCGNNIVEPGETCDPSGTCPTVATCADKPACTQELLVGNPESCNATCGTPVDITVCIGGDGCCPAGCTNGTDTDCSALCGNRRIDAGETCDGADCPTSCTPSNSCASARLIGSASNCSAACVEAPITAPASGDGCCPPGANAGVDNDCGAVCGNGVLEGAELCEGGSCPSDCADGNACTIDSLSGGAATCDAACINAPITACSSGDGCCPLGCSAATDTDCTAVCGNGVVEPGESCEGAGCPVFCDDGIACTTDLRFGDVSTCDARCEFVEVSAPVNGDACCPNGADATNDTDCSAICGNGVVEPGERCEGASCPTTCSDGVSCTTDSLTGSAATCNAQCVFAPITACASGDGCCAAGCNNNNDADCAGVCGNGILEAGEACDPLSSCPTTASCQDADPCTLNTAVGTGCNVSCSTVAVTDFFSGDLCCPVGATANSDTDCNPVCGNGVVEPGEVCDGSCPAACADDGNVCTANVLNGSAAACSATCSYPAITACVNADGCCAPGCTATNDSDCVAGIDPASPVTLTSACLTAGLPGPAQGAVVLTLRDTRGNPVTGAAVTMTSSLGTLSAVTATDNSYVATLSAPGTGSGTATITITANGTAITPSPSITIAARFSDVTGGTGGCGADGNVRVRAVDPAGNPIAGAVVMVGTAPSTALTVTYGGAATGSNNATTDADGYAVFRDFGSTLDGALTVTAGATDREYVTITGSNAADFVLPIRPLRPTLQTGTFTGQLTNITGSGNIEAGLMLADTDLNNLATFSFAGLLARSECPNLGATVGSISLPANVYVPNQTVLFVVGVNEHRYTSAPVTFGNRFLYGLGGNLPLSAVTGGGGLTSALGTITLTNFGGAATTVNAAGPTARNIALTTATRANVNCALTNYPAASDVFCVSIGDIDSGGTSPLTLGEGRLIFQGFKTAVATTTTSTAVNLNGLTTVDNVGALANMEYLSVSAAFYNDKARVGIPAGTANGTSAIFNRTGTDLFNGNPTLTFNNYLPVRTLTRAARTFTLNSATNATSPAAPDFTDLTVRQVVNTTYSACATNDSSESARYPVWRLIAPAAATSVALPTLPAGWPRANLAGDLSGLIDPAATAENDSLEIATSTTDMGIHPGFSYPAFRFADFVKYATHVSSNQANF